MDNIDSQKEYSYFIFNCQISFLSFDPVNCITIPVNVILQLEQTTLINLETIEIAKKKSIQQLVENIGKEKAELLGDIADIITVSVTPAFLGTGTHEQFLNKE